MSVGITGYISKYGLVVLFAGALDGQGRLCATNFLSVPTTPSLYLNGSGSPIANVQGPFWANTNHNCPFIILQLPFMPTAEDLYAFSAPSAWGTVATGGTVPAATLQSLPNYFGQYEPAVLYFANMGPLANQTIQVPGFGDATRTLMLGMNAGAVASQQRFYPYSPAENWFKRQVGFSNVSGATAGTNWRPTTLSAAAVTTNPVIAIAGSDNAIDSRGCPSPTGIFTFIADETAPNTPMTVAISATNATIIGSGSNPGTLIGGVEVGKTWWANIQYSASPPTTYAIQVSLTIGGAGGTYPAPWTLRNESLVPPQADGTAPSVLNNQTPTAPDPQVLSWLTTPRARTPNIVRFMDSVLGTDGTSGVVEPSHLRNVGDWSWQESQASPSTLTITAIRFYDLTVSPNIFTNQQYTNTATAPGGSPAKYQFTPATNYFMNFSGSSPGGWWVGEAVCNAPHNLSTGSLVTCSSSGFSGITVTNGPSATVTVSLNNVELVAYVTGPDTFSFIAVSGSINTPQPGPQYVNMVVGSNTTTGTATAVAPDPGSLPYETAAGVCAAFDGTNIWVNLPVAGTDATIAAIAQKVRDNFPAGRQIWLEYSNEVWSNIPATLFCFAMGQLGSIASTPVGRAEWYCLRAGQHKQTFIDVFNEVDINGNRNRGSEIKLVIGGQYDTSNLGGLIAATNNANTLLPGSVPADAFAGAPYFDAPTDSTFVAACASIYAAQSSSTQFGNAYPFTRAQWLDVLRHFARYTSMHNGPTGYFQNAVAAVATYVPTASQGAGFVPLIVGYEAAQESLAQLAIAVASTYLQHIATHDLYYDPANYDLEQAFHQAMQLGGLTWANKYSLCVMHQQSTGNQFVDHIWGTWAHSRQGWGPGDGSNGSTLNQFYDFVKSQAQDGNNVSVRGQAVRDWMDLANPGSSDPVYPTVTAVHRSQLGGFVLGGPRAVLGGPDDAIPFVLTPFVTPDPDQSEWYFADTMPDPAQSEWEFAATCPDPSSSTWSLFGS